MTLLIGAWTIGLILSLLALGVYITFRIFDFPDITTDGSITLGAAVAAVLLVAGYPPLVATAAGFIAGVLAGATTGLLHTTFKINGLLSGILVMTALYSVNLHIMGKSNVPLLHQRTLASDIEALLHPWIPADVPLHALGWEISGRELGLFLASLLGASLCAYTLFLFFRTDLGTAMRATGNNPQMIRALGVNVERMKLLGLALANGLVGLSGALLAQYQGFADVQMGIGMVVWGLASVIIGEALVGGRSLGLTLAATIIGSVLFRLLVAIALQQGLNPNDLKLATALFVFIALVLPGLLRRWRSRRPAQTGGAPC